MIALLIIYNMIFIIIIYYKPFFFYLNQTRINSISNVSDLDDEGSEEDEEVLPEAEQNISTRQGYLSCINEASDGQHLLDIINLLPNSAQHYGHSLTMNAIIKIISRHLVFCEQSNPLFVTKHKSRKDVQVTATFSSLSKKKHKSFSSVWFIKHHQIIVHGLR
jgi:hypothetical protein